MKTELKLLLTQCFFKDSFIEKKSAIINFKSNN